MIRSLLRRRQHHLQTLTVSHPFSSGPPRHWNNKKKAKKQTTDLPPPDPTLLAKALSSLPPRFTPTDLSHAISSLPDPSLAPHLLLSATSPSNPLPHPDPLLTAIKLLGRHNLIFPHLHSLASLALSSPPLLSLPLCNTLLYFYSSSRSLFRALSVYNLMRDSPNTSLRPTLSTYNNLFSALLGPDRSSNSYIHHLYMDTIRTLFRQMLHSHIAPDLTTLNFLLRGYVYSLHVNDALRIFHQMIPVYDIHPDANTYNYLIHGLCAQGRTRNAMEMYGEMRGKGFRVGERAGNSLVSALAMGGEAGEAVEVMWEVAGTRRRVEAITARTVVERMCEEGKGREAEGLVTEMREREVVDGRMFRELMDGIRGSQE